MSNPVLRDDPRDHLTHAWTTVGGEWWSLCGRAADPDTLTDPGGHQHVECMLLLGARVAERQAPGGEWRQ